MSLLILLLVLLLVFGGGAGTYGSMGREWAGVGRWRPVAVVRRRGRGAHPAVRRRAGAWAVLMADVNAAVNEASGLIARAITALVALGVSAPENVREAVACLGSAYAELIESAAEEAAEQGGGAA
jgi:hypothetical protein